MRCHSLSTRDDAQVMQSLEQNFWGLEKSPFASGLETRLFYEGAAHREALARLRFLRANRRLGLVLGEPGTGKSLVLKVYCRECRKLGLAVASINLCGLSAREFYWQLGSQLAAAVRVEDDLVRLFRQVSDRIHANRLQSLPTVVLVDDVHEAGPDLLAQLMRLAQLDAAHGAPTLVLATRTAQASRLGEQLLELVDLRIDLEPWDELDTVGYLQLALVEAGCERPLFDDDSLTEIHHLTGGVPRHVNRLAEHALWLGAANAPEIIDTTTIRAAHAELTGRARG
jgi:type II secretory pathway predicted ATPase ExeA